MSLPFINQRWRCRFLFALLLSFVSATCLRAEETGTVTGLVVSTWDGTPLTGVAVTVRGTTLATQTDGNGRFELKSVAPGDQVLRFSRSGFASAVVTEVRVLIGQTTTVNANLRPEFYEMEEYEVTAEEISEQTEKILIERQHSSSLMDAIGAEQFSKVGAGDAAEIVTRVTGVSVVEGRYAVIRGLTDRYSSTLLNGAEVPSADPYRRAAQLDLFPAAMIDRVIISKTFTPDQPGGFAGGSINLITKPFPDKTFFNFSAGVAYNTQSTGNDRFLTGPEGDLDYWATDNGFRAVPQGPWTIDQGPGSSTRELDIANAVVKQARSFEDPSFAPERNAPGPDTDWALSLGTTLPLFKDMRVGLIGGLNHSIKYRYYEDGEYNRFTASSTPGQLALIRSYERDRGSSESQWGGVAGVGLEISPQHQLSYTVVNNQTAENVGQVQEGQSVILGGVALVFKGYTERNLFNQEFKGEHQFDFLHGLHLGWLASLSDTSQDEPSLRYYPMQLTATNASDPTIFDITSAGADIPDARAPTIYSRKLTEHNGNYRMDFTLPFGDQKEDVRDVKFGLNLSYSEREYADQRLLFEINESLGPQSGRIESFPDQKLNLKQYGFTEQIITRKGVSVTNYVFDHPVTRVASSYDGTQDIPAGYLMGDWTFTPWLRAAAGVRYEETSLEVVSSGGNGQIEEKDWLPAVTLTFALNKTMDVRVSYSQTIARPTYREFAPVGVYDFYSDEFVVGNPNLRRTQISNYDLRWEWFPAPGDLVSAGIFYKDLSDPIEKYVTRQIETLSFINRPEAKLYGFELESRKNLGFLGEPFAGFSVGGNFTYIDGTVTIAPDIDPDGTVFVEGGERDALFDQSKFIINADVSFTAPKAGFSATVGFNMASERLVVSGSNSPDIYEQPAPLLDIILSQRLGKHFKLTFSAKNLLNPDIKQTYGKDGEFPQYGPYSSYTRGATFSLGLGAEF